MPICQQLWSMECYVIESIASLLHGEMEFKFKVNDIQAVRKSTTDQCNNFSAYQWKRHRPTFCHFKKLQWYSHTGEMSFFDKLILGVCLLHPVFLSDVLNDVIGIKVTIVQTLLYPTAEAILPRFTTCVFSKAENLRRFYDPPGIY